MFGIYVNNRAPLYLPDYSTNRLLEAGSLAEALAFDSLWVGDSAIAKPRLEPLLVLSALAARTSRIKLGTSIFQPHLRHPVWTALSWASLDRISDGRTILGAGIGGGPAKGMTKEAEVFGLPKGGRGMAMVESIEAVKALWTQDVVTFEGKYVPLQDVTLGYKPLQQPHPPIWIGAGGWGSISTRIEPGTNTKPFDRVAQLGDGWFMGPALPSEFDQSWTTIQTLAQERGRDPQSIHRAMEVWININDVREKAFEEGRTLMEKYYQVSFSDTHLERAFLGTPADVATKFESFLKAGAQTFVLVFHAMDPIEQMKKFADDVLPSFQNRT